MTDPRFERLMEAFEARGIPRVPWEKVHVGPDNLTMKPRLTFSVHGPRDSSIQYEIEDHCASVNAWFGHSSHDSGGMYLHGQLRMKPEDVVEKPRIVVAATEAQVQRARFYDIINRARAYPMQTPPPPKPEPAWKQEEGLREILALHKRYMQSGRQKVITNFQRARFGHRDY